MSSASDMLLAINRLNYKKDAEEQQAEILNKLKVLHGQERTKRLGLETALRKCASSEQELRFLLALKNAENKSYEKFHTLMEQNILMQETLVNKVKSFDWEEIELLWNFKFKTRQRQNEKILQRYREQLDEWKTKMRSIPIINYVQRNYELLKEKEKEYAAQQKEFKNRKEQLDGKLSKSKDHLQDTSAAFELSQKKVADLRQKAKDSKEESKRLDELKLQKQRKIKELQREIMRLEQSENLDQRRIVKNNLKTEEIPRMEVFKPRTFKFSIPKLKKATMVQKHTFKEIKLPIVNKELKTSIPPLARISTKSENFPREIEGNALNKTRQTEKNNNLKLKSDHQIKILEHVVLTPRLQNTTNDNVSEKNVDSLDGKTITLTPKILQQNEHSGTGVEEELVQGTEKEISKIMKKFSPRSHVKANDDISLITKNITKVQRKTECNTGEKEKFVGLENILANEEKSENVSLSKITEEDNFKFEDCKEENLKEIKGLKARKSHPFESQDVSTTNSDMKKRKIDKPTTSRENIDSKHSKTKADHIDLGFLFDSKSMNKGDEGSLVDRPGFLDEINEMLRKSSELCGGEESNDQKLEQVDVFSQNSQQNNDEMSWAGFGNAFNFNDTNKDNDDDEFYKLFGK